MASLRPMRCHAKLKGHAYTRTAKRVRTKEFIRGVPHSKIVKFNYGNKTEKFKYEVRMVAKGNANVRHNALESMRILVNKSLVKTVGDQAYFFQIRAYPHHVIRDNKMVSGAGADRISSGMRLSFGKPAGRAAICKSGKIIAVVRVNTKKEITIARQILKKGANKLSVSCLIEDVEIVPKAS